MSMPWVLYILECADGTFYTGITNDLDQRLQKHESGTGAKYTKGRGPFKLAHLETLQNRSEASKREIAVKALRREEKLKLIGKRQG
jgi:predicted GIY-YIG superfamily endonuclease